MVIPDNIIHARVAQSITNNVMHLKYSFFNHDGMQSIRKSKSWPLQIVTGSKKRKVLARTGGTAGVADSGNVFWLGRVVGRGVSLPFCVQILVGQ